MFLLQNNAVVIFYLSLGLYDVHLCFSFPWVLLELLAQRIVAPELLFDLLLQLQPQKQRGAANGISTTAMSIFRAIGPAGGGAL